MTQYLSNFTQKFQPTDTFVDPVSKFRVSQPANLTDTDFEYGLQESKWETLERVNNIPTFFSRYGDPSLDIDDIIAIQNSDRVVVSCTSPHNLIVGSPIIVSGLTSNSAEGAYVVIRVNSDTSFEYSAKRTQSFPGLADGATFSIKLDESTISIGKLYQGTQYKLDNLDLIQTDGKDPSQLTVQTNSPHGFSVGTKFILSNTVGGKTFKFDASLIQPQSLSESSVETDLTAKIDNTKSYESLYATHFDWRGRYGVFVTAENVNVRQNTIYAPNHGFIHGDIVVYIAPRTTKGALGNPDYSIGGLANYTPYWVIYIDDDNFALTTTDTNYQLTTSSSTYVFLSHPGNTDFAPHHFAKGYRIVASSTTEQTLAFVNRDIENGMDCVLVSTGTGLAGVARSTDNFNSNAWTKYYYQNTTNQTGTGYGVLKIPFSNITVATDLITSPTSLSAADFKTGDEVRFYQGGTVPGGVGNGSLYWIRVVNDTQFYLYTNRANAISGTTTSRIIITNQGAGTHTVEKTRRWMRFATNPSLTAFATTNTTAPNGTTLVVPIIDLTSTSRDSIYVENHNLETSDVVLVDSDLLATGISREIATTDANVNDTGKISFEGNTAHMSNTNGRLIPFSGITGSKYQNGTRVRYEVKPDFAYFICSNVNLTTDVITTEGDTRYSSLRSFKTGEAVTLDVFPESITFQLQSMSNPNADTTIFNTNSTKLYENANVSLNPVKVKYKASSGPAYASPANTIAGRELIDGNEYYFRNNSTNVSFILHTTKAGAISNTTATRVRPVTTGNGIGIITAVEPLPEGLSTDTTYYIRVLSNTTFSLHTTRQGAIDNTNRVDIINAGPGTRARVRQLEPTPVTGLTPGQDYYLRNITNTQFELYNNRFNAMNTGSTSGLTTFSAPVLDAGNGRHQFNAIEHVVTTTGRSGTTGSLMTVPDSSIFVAGQEVTYLNNVLGTATATPGLTFGGKYFVRPVATTTISLHRNASGAINNTNFVTISGAAGAGSGTLFVASSSIPTVGDGFSYIVERLSSDRIRLRESQSAATFQPLLPLPYTSSSLKLTKRTPAENAETIFINQHGLSQGTALQYNSASFAPVPIFSEFNNGYSETTLTNNAEYYVVTPSQNRFRLSRTPDSLVYNFTATAATVDTTAFTLAIPNHGIRTGDKVVYESVNPITGLISGGVYYALRMNDSIISFNNATSWNTTTDRVTVTHGYGVAGTIFPVIYRTATHQGASSTGNAAGGLQLEALYWARVIDASTLELYPTQANAVSQTARVDVTSQGTGTGYFERSNRIALFYAIRDLFDNQANVLTIDPLTPIGQAPSDSRIAILSFVNGTSQRVTEYDLVDFSQAGEPGEQELGNVLPNAVDGIYEIESIEGDSSSKKFVLSPTNAILSPRSLTFDPREVAQLQYSMFNFNSHSLYDRAPVIYNPDRQVDVGQVFWIAPDPNPAVDTNESTFINVTHGITQTVRARYESQTPVYPLENNTSYFLAAISPTSFAVYETEEDADSDTNRIELSDNFGNQPIEGTGSFFIESIVTPLGGLENNTTYYVIRRSADFIALASTILNAENGTEIQVLDAGVPGELHTIQTFNVAAEVEGLGTLNTTLNSNIVTGSGTSFFNLFKIGDSLNISVPRTNLIKTVTQNGTNMASNGTVTLTAHGFATGEAVRYNSISPATTLADGFVYYTRVLSASTFTLHPSSLDAVDNLNIITFPVAPSGTGTFTTIYPGTVFEAKINGIKTDTSLIIDKPIPALDSDVATTPVGTQIGLKYLIGSTLYVKGDGFAIHRPFDGGVELTPSLNPDSQVTRQTRKYFRYQSGKGIQVSFGINFNAPVQIDSMTVNSAGLATVKTRFPNRITPGLTLDIVKAEDQFFQQPRFISDENASVNLTNNTLNFISPHLYNNGLGVKYESNNPLGELLPGTTYYVRINEASPETSIELYKTLNAAIIGDQLARVGLDDSPINATLIPENPWNGEYEVIDVLDERRFRVQLSSQPPSPFAQGFPQYTPKAWSNAYLRAGMFDDQNGMYFEYDGNDLYVCRRSSTNQLSGTIEARFNSGEIIGTGTIFFSQLDVGDKIVIRGQTYKVVNISSNEVLHVQPPYSGESKSNIIVSKVEEIRIPQSDWNIDKADGNGPSGFKLDLTKMQMAYMDYSWYGAGKVRFGFKGVTGDVNYFHEMVHNNLETEAYLRSGNLPTRYEVENKGTPSYSPTIAHWGTSVIMDGGFDDDKAYQFNAASRTLSFTNTPEQLSFSGTIPSTAIFTTVTDPDTGLSTPVYRIVAATYTSVQNIRNNTAISGTNIAPGTTTIGTPVRSGNQGWVYIDKQPLGVVTAATNFNYGPAQDLVPLIIPLVSVRLGPAVDNGFVGRIGVRDIINRMQLALAQVGIITTHDVNVKLLLNPNLDNIVFEGVQKPSLSQLIRHNKFDTVSQGVEVYNFRANGNSTATTSIASTTIQQLSDVFELGNSILGGDGTFPDGPDIITVAVEPIDLSLVGDTTPFRVSASITWTESQA